MATIATQPKSNIVFAPARVRHVFDTAGLNHEVNAALEPHKSVVKQHKLCKEALSTGKITIKVTKAADGTTLEKPTKESRALTEEEILGYKKQLDELEPKLKSAEDMVKLLSHEKIRFSNGASPVLAVVCEEIVKEMLVGAISVIKASSMKIIYPKHIFASEQPTKYHSLYQNLSSFASKKNLFEAEQRAKRAQKELDTALALAKKEWAKEKNIQQDKKKEAIKTPKAKVEKPEKAAEETNAGDSFKVYVGHVISGFKKEESYASLRFSDDVRNFLAEVTIEFVKNLAAKVQIDVVSRKNKTITPAVIMRVVEYLMIDGHQSETKLIFGEESRPNPELVKQGMSKDDISKLPKVLCKTVSKKITYIGCHYDELYCTVVKQLTAAGHDQKLLGL